MHLDWSLATWLSSMKAVSFLLCNQSRALALRCWRWSLGFDLKECQGIEHLCNPVFNQSCILYVYSGHCSLCTFFSRSPSPSLSPTLFIHVIVLWLHNRLWGEWLFKFQDLSQKHFPARHTSLLQCLEGKTRRARA